MALERVWDAPQADIALLWAGSRALGLHPWHPEALNRTAYQLTWAVLLAKREEGEDPLETRNKHRQQRLDEQAGELVAWADAHVTKWRGL